jgi:D-ribose pyranase
MKTSGVIHPGLLELIAAAGHGDLIVLADAGLRIPSDKLRIDLGLTCGVPTMAQVLGAVKQDLVIEAAIIAVEFPEWSPDAHADVVALLDVSPTAMPHVELMAEMAEKAYAYVKTGDCAAYSSVVLQCGVSFLDEAIALHRSLQG